MDYWLRQFALRVPGWEGYLFSFLKCLRGTGCQSPLVSTDHKLLILILRASHPHLSMGTNPQVQETVHCIMFGWNIWSSFLVSLSLSPPLSPPEIARRLFSQNSNHMLNFCFEINNEQKVFSGFKLWECVFFFKHGQVNFDEKNSITTKTFQNRKGSFWRRQGPRGI